MHALKPIPTSDFALRRVQLLPRAPCARDVPDEEARDTACEIRSTRKIAGFVGAYLVVVENDSRHLPAATLQCGERRRPRLLIRQWQIDCVNHPAWMRDT